MDWIGLNRIALHWITLDWVRIFRELYGLIWIGLGGMTLLATFLKIGNCCSTVDDVYLSFTTIKSQQ